MLPIALKFSRVFTLNLKLTYKHLILKNLSAFLLFIILSLNLNAQGITRHFISHIPLSGQSNPSLYPEYRFTLGIPMANWFTEYNTNFSLKNIMADRSHDTLYITPGIFLSKLDRLNFVNFESDFEIISTSLKIKKNYFSFFLTNKTWIEARYPRDLFSLAWKGNAQFIGSFADFRGMGVDFINYNEYAIGWSRAFADKFSLGAHVKYLQGLMNFKTATSDITLKVDTTTYWLTADYSLKIKIAAPVDTNGISIHSAKDVLTFGNRGLGLDLGGTYKFNDKLKLSASLLDLGYIHWTKNTKSYFIENQQIKFEGIKIDSTFSFNFSDSTLKIMTDTLLEKFRFSKNYEPFTTGLNPKLYLTASYDLTQHDRLGFVLYNRFYKYYNYMSYSLLYQHRFGNILSFTTSMTLNSRGNAKIGAGITWRIFGSNFYVITDNITGFFNPLSMQSLSINFGWYYVKVSPGKGKAPKATF